MKNIGFPECARGCPEVIRLKDKIEPLSETILDHKDTIRDLKRRNAVLANALSAIKEWEFNIMGDCVKDAQQLAERALREEYKILIGKL